jgi:hypothetical protein
VNFEIDFIGDGDVKRSPGHSTGAVNTISNIESMDCNFVSRSYHKPSTAPRQLAFSAAARRPPLRSHFAPLSRRVALGVASFNCIQIGTDAIETSKWFVIC